MNEIPRIHNSGKTIAGAAMTDSSIVCGLDDILDYTKARYMNELILKGISIFHKQINVNASKDDIFNLLSCHGCQYLRGLTRNHTDVYIFHTDNVYVSVRDSDTMPEVAITGEHGACSWVMNLIDNAFDFGSIHVRWIYDAQYLESMNVMIPNKNLPFTEMFPFLNGETIYDYYDRFMTSDASILVLLGPPGTGKTSMIRGLLHHTQKNAILTYNPKLLEQDSFFAEWFRSNDEDIVIMEDADNLLLPRSDGNDMMSRFLNLGDGLLSISGKKMIFTTNLPSTADIDPALLRPGRCHDVIDFRRLTRTEAAKVAEITNTPFTKDGDSFSIAEIFSDSKTKKHTHSFNFGFVP